MSLAAQIIANHKHCDVASGLSPKHCAWSCQTNSERTSLLVAAQKVDWNLYDRTNKSKAFCLYPNPCDELSLVFPDSVLPETKQACGFCLHDCKQLCLWWVCHPPKCELSRFRNLHTFGSMRNSLSPLLSRHFRGVRFFYCSIHVSTHVTGRVLSQEQRQATLTPPQKIPTRGRVWTQLKQDSKSQPKLVCESVCAFIRLRATRVKRLLRDSCSGAKALRLPTLRFTCRRHLHLFSRMVAVSCTQSWRQIWDANCRTTIHVHHIHVLKTNASCKINPL